MDRGISGDKVANFSSVPNNLEHKTKGINPDASLECIYSFAEIIAKQDREISRLKSQLELIKSDLENHLESNYIDPLTGCFSVKLFERIKNEQFNPILDVNRIAIVFIDANGLKEINNTPIEQGGGHDAGDKMIQDIANYLRESFRIEDVIIRPYSSGDEFIVVCKNQGNNPEFEKLIRKRVREIRIGAQNKPFSFACGVAVYGVSKSKFPDKNLDDTKRRAEEKMYRCKERMYRCKEC